MIISLRANKTNLVNSIYGFNDGQVWMLTGSVVYTLMVVLLRRTRGAIGCGVEVSETRWYSNEQRDILPRQLGIYGVKLLSEGGEECDGKRWGGSINAGPVLLQGRAESGKMHVSETYHVIYFFNQCSSHLLTSAFVGRDCNRETDGVSWRLEWV